MQIISSISQNLNIPDDSDVFIFDLVDDKSFLESSDIVIGKNCRVTYLYVFNLNLGADFSQVRNLTIGDNSIVDAFRLVIGKTNSIFDFNNALLCNSVLNNNVIVFQAHSQKFDFKDAFEFKSTGATGKFKVDSILDNGSNLKYFSDLIIDRDSQETDSRIDMRAYIFDDGSRVSFLPGLKISANSVKAGHSASTFKLSDEDLFYLNSRGIGYSNIKSLVVRSLINNFIKGINNVEFENIVKSLIDAVA